MQDAFAGLDLGAGTELEGYATLLDWPNLTTKLAERGFNEDEIRGLIGGNYLRFFREVVG